MVCGDWAQNRSCFLSSILFFQPDFRQLFSDDSQSDTGYLDLSLTRTGETRTKAFLSFFFLKNSALRLYFKITNTHIRRPLQIYFTLTSFCVNLGCRRGLNVAVITGYYESHVSLVVPNVNDERHRKFLDDHKKLIAREQRRYECVHMCTTMCVCSIGCVGVYAFCAKAIYFIVQSLLLVLRSVLEDYAFYWVNTL